MPSFEKSELAYTLTWDADWVSAVAFVGPRRVAAGNNLGQIVAWELPETLAKTPPPPTLALDGHSNQITRLIAPKDGRALYSASFDRTIRVWDLSAKPGAERSLTLNARAIEDAKRRSGAKKIDPIDAKVRSLTPSQMLTGHKEWVNTMSLSFDEKFLLAGDDAGEVVLWDRATLKEVRRWKAKGWCYACGLSPDNTRAIVSERLPLVFDSGRHAGLRIWDATTGELKHDLGADFKGMHFIVARYSPDGKFIILGRGGECDGPNGKISLLDSKTNKKVKDLEPGHLNGMTDLAFHPDGQHVATCGRDTLVRIWDLASGKMVKELGKSRGGQFKDWIHAVSFSPDGQWLAAADMIGSVQVWKLA
jgi:WD40 repeat protein